MQQNDSMDNTCFDILSEEYIWGGIYYKGKVSNICMDILDDTIPRAGGSQIRFITNSAKIQINAKISNIATGNYPNVGITTRCGLSFLYRKENEEEWYPLDIVSPKGETIKLDIDMCRFVNVSQPQEIMICLPIMANLINMDIKIEKGKWLRPIPKDKIKSSILIVGGIHSFGIGCTSSSLMFSNILARKENAIVYNLSFNTRNHLSKLNEYLDKILPKGRNIDYIIFEGDYIRQDRNVFSQMFPIILNMLNALKCPILVWGVKSEVFENDLYDIGNCRFIDTNTFFGTHSDKYTFSPNFLNDAGNIMLYKWASRWIHDSCRANENNVNLENFI